jgi:hypothetical protein
MVEQHPNEAGQLNKCLECLEEAKRLMVGLSGQSAVSGQDWDKAQCLLQWARDVDAILQGLRRNKSEPLKIPQTPSGPSIPAKLPYYCIQDDRLVKVGASREGGTYEHRVTRKNFDLVVRQLCEMAAQSRTFETQRLVDRCDIPKHEPLIVVNVLAESSLLLGRRRGRWAFADTTKFPSDVQTVWSELPRR